MKHTTKKENQLSRRGFIPIIGSALLLPFLGFSKSENNETPIVADNEEYQTLLKPDGTAVNVKVSTLKNAKIIKKNVSNKSFLNWLGRKL